jgi:hypothetical protein
VEQPQLRRLDRTERALEAAEAIVATRARLGGDRFGLGAAGFAAEFEGLCDSERVCR